MGLFGAKPVLAKIIPVLITSTMLRAASSLLRPSCRRFVSTNPKDVGYIGLGAMGTPMVRNMMDAGFNVSVYDSE
jgi:hypothetical protein